MPIRVLVIDDSAIVRKLLTRVLEVDPEINVVGTAPDPFVGRDKVVSLKPDVLLLDIEMPRMDGITFLKRLMQHYPMPVLIVSSLTTEGGDLAIEALRAGAVDVISKPHGAYTLGDLGPELIAKVKMAAAARVNKRTAPTSGPNPASGAHLVTARVSHTICAIGASTGGTKALEVVLERLPANCPGILVVQHMPEQFTKPFANRLNEISAMEVKEAEDGDVLTPGRVLIAPGGKHMVLRRSGALYRAGVVAGPPVNRHRPSVDVLFDSVAENAGKNALGVLLTGMGDDGAHGLLKMKESGAATVAQDEATSVVYGMPKAAVDLGAAQRVMPLEHVAQAIVAFGGEGRAYQDGEKGHAGSGRG